MRQWIFATGFSLLAAPISSHAADLALSVDGVRSSRGNILAGAFVAFVLMVALAPSLT